ncbi:unnamed protein product [Rhizophagus irregularis]|nr:unnamed protein product [Rhizophagus irregularis]CAB5337850.1 unnamed protein product [Rhizophagus irregularis]
MAVHPGKLAEVEVQSTFPRKIKEEAYNGRNHAKHPLNDKIDQLRPMIKERWAIVICKYSSYQLYSPQD